MSLNSQMMKHGVTLFLYLQFFQFNRYPLDKIRYNNLNFILIFDYYLFLIKRDMSTFTITFGDQAENHKGMQIIGKMAERGFSPKDLQDSKAKFQKQGYHCDLISLNPYIADPNIKEKADQACVLVVRKGVDCLLDEDSRNLFDELFKLNWDSKAFMYGRVVTKHARHNLCFGQEKQEPDYQNGMGRIISWESVPLLSNLRNKLGSYIKEADDLTAEGNFYYDVNKCGLGFHGDGERKKVIALRLCNGKCNPLHYQWFLRGKPIGKRAIIELNDRDIYVMSEKAVGTDWKKKIIPTLRHATGTQKFTTI